MERSVAIKKLSKLLGKGFAYRVNDKAPSPDERKAAMLAAGPAFAEVKRLDERLEARRKEILAADEDYQNLRAETKKARDEADRLRSITLCHKITVGNANSLFFNVKAEGDSWEDVIEKVTTGRS